LVFWVDCDKSPLEHRAMSYRHLRVALAALFVCTPALARDNGQFGNVSDDVRAWFKSVKSPHGVPCCDIADGHRTDYDMRNNQYWVPINGEWTPVPPEAVIRNAGNPIGDAVVWYSSYGTRVVIRCFVPGGGA
jgi:hypothetical protein